MLPRRPLRHAGAAGTPQGVPTHTKWFWVSRRVFMLVEPAYFSVMSAGARRCMRNAQRTHTRRAAALVLRCAAAALCHGHDAGVIFPSVGRSTLRFSPGFCSAEMGAVEHVDWRSYNWVSALAGTHGPTAKAFPSASPHTALVACLRRWATRAWWTRRAPTP